MEKSNYSFLVQLKNKDNAEKEIDGMKDLYLKINDLDYELIDDLISIFVVLNFSFQFHVALLAATLTIKNKLNNRDLLFENAMMAGEKIMNENELKRTLLGLN